jgi:hypothetical protein
MTGSQRRHHQAQILRGLLVDAPIFGSAAPALGSSPHSRVTVPGESRQHLGTDGNDTLHGRNQAARINGGVGHDVVYGGEGSDTMWGMRGDDLLDGGERSNLPSGGRGMDTCLRADDMDFTCEPARLHRELGEVATGGVFAEPRYPLRVEVDGTWYERGIESYHGHPSTSEYYWWEYHLGREYRTFVATIGHDARGTSFQARFRFEVIADGNPVFSKTLWVSESVSIRVDVTNTRRLRLKLTPVQPSDGYARPVWASPLVSANPEIRPLPPTDWVSRKRSGSKRRRGAAAAV